MMSEELKYSTLAILLSNLSIIIWAGASILVHNEQHFWANGLMILCVGTVAYAAQNIGTWWAVYLNRVRHQPQG